MKWIALLFFSSVAAAQTASTSAPCSPIALNNTGAITINCSGMTKEDGRKMVAILNKIRTNRRDPELVMTKLDEIQLGVSTIEKELTSKRQQEEATDKKRRTAPIIYPSLVPLEPGKVALCIRSDNLIPYDFRYFITDSKHSNLGGFPISLERVFPTAETPSHCISKDIDLHLIEDHYIELQFTFKSLSYDELHLPGHGGDVIVKYRVSPDGTSVSLIP